VNDERERTRKAMRHVAVVRSILMRWDPIGIRPGELGPAGEYDNYAPHIVSLVSQGCSVPMLARHLGDLRTGTIRAGPDPERDHEIAKEIVEALSNETV